jgi:hypothetical protein
MYVNFCKTSVGPGCPGKSKNKTDLRVEGLRSTECHEPVEVTFVENCGCKFDT